MPAYQVYVRIELRRGFEVNHSDVNLTSGDSYSSITSMGYNSEIPTSENPLGVNFPGETWNEPGLPNWVGYLITEYCPKPRYKLGGEGQVEAYVEAPLLVYNYAQGGDTVAGVCRQVDHWFLPNAGKRPEWARWTPETSLFITWVGINDCAYACDAAHTIGILFSRQQRLYDAGARNFLFLDVPPIDRSPAGACIYIVLGNRSSAADNTRNRINTWNAALREAIHTFASDHEDTTCLLFSTNRTFNALLDDPARFGLPAAAQQSDFWVDHIHPTSKVHDAVAKSIGEFLSSVNPFKAEDE